MLGESSKKKPNGTRINTDKALRTKYEPGGKLIWAWRVVKLF
jgi:hypothetical protein